MVTSLSRASLKTKRLKRGRVEDDRALVIGCSLLQQEAASSACILAGRVDCLDHVIPFSLSGMKKKVHFLNYFIALPSYFYLNFITEES